MPDTRPFSREALPADLAGGAVLFLVATPLLLGIAAASGAPVISGVISGIIGGLLVGRLSGSPTSVSGPSAGLIAVTVLHLGSLGSFPAFLLAVVLAGLIQIGLGLLRAGFVASFFPNSVIRGLLAAIGLILILKQIPHVLGHDTDPEGEMSFLQPDRENTFSEFGELLFDVHPGAAVVGLASLVVLLLWNRWPLTRRLALPAPLAVLVIGVGLNLMLQPLGGRWSIQSSHLVQLPVAQSLADFARFLQFPDLRQLLNPSVYSAAISLAVIASLETLLNLVAVDRLDPKQRTSPASRELMAQGLGNVAAGLLGGLPISADAVRGAVNLDTGSRTKGATIVHGGLLLLGVLLFPRVVNLVPLSCVAAILLFTGVRLAAPLFSPAIWRETRYHLAPFLVTIVAIVFTDLVTGILIGLAVSLGFILNSNFRRPLRRTVERHLGGEVLHITLADQVSFLNRGRLAEVLDAVPRGGQVLLDAQNTDYIDQDVLDLIRDYREHTAPARKIRVSLLGFRSKYQLDDRIEYVDYSTRELQQQLTPALVLQILKDGHERFRTGRRLTRDFSRQIQATGSEGQHPMAVILSCIDSRTPAELLFDLGVGDIFTVRVAGNTTSPKVLGSIEYGCAVAGAKLVLVMGHTRCGAVTTAVKTACSSESVADLTGCQHVEHVLKDIQETIDMTACARLDEMSPAEQEEFMNDVVRANVLRTVEVIRERSQTLARLADEGKIAIVGTIYDVVTGDFTFWTNELDDLPALIAQGDGQPQTNP